MDEAGAAGTRAAAEARPRPSAQGLAAPAPIALLEGCWMVTAPDSLQAVLRSPRIVRQVGDSLVLALSAPAPTTVTVRRDGDALQGALSAVRTSCPTP